VQSESRRRWLILAAMTGTLSMMMLDATVVSVALPSIQRELDLTQTELQWVVNAYLLSLAAQAIAMIAVQSKPLQEGSLANLSG
jgi:MFS family permease